MLAELPAYKLVCFLNNNNNKKISPWDKSLKEIRISLMEIRQLAKYSAMSYFSFQFICALFSCESVFGENSIFICFKKMFVFS